MQQIGTIDERDDAELFRSYLFSRGIELQIDPVNGEHEIWVYDYDLVPAARDELKRFQTATNRSDYVAAADAYRKQRLSKRATPAPKVVDATDRSEVPFLHQVPITLSLVAICLVVYYLTSGFGSGTVADLLSISAYPPLATSVETAIPFVSYGRLPEVARGEIWRLVTPIFLHKTMPHIFFNLLWLVPLGGAIEYRHGQLRFATLVLVIAVISNLVQFAYAGPRFVGISGVDAGLFGYLLFYTQFAPDDGLYVDRRTSAVMLLYLGLCLTPVIPDTANGSHLAGLATGAGLAALFIGLRRARRQASSDG